MADNVKDLLIRLTLQNDQLIKANKKAQDSFDQTKKKTSGLKDGIKKLSGSFKLLAAVAVAGVGVALGKATKKAIDFEEAVNKFNVTFKGASKEADKLRKNLVNNFALSSREATNLLSNTGDLLSGFGITGKAAVDLAGKTNTLAADLASFANVPVTQASEAITKGLLGERESMKALGIAIGETDVQQRLLQKGQNNLQGQALKAAKAQATLELAYEQSTNAIGDFERSQDSTANQIKKVKAIADDLQVAIGSELLGALKPTINEFSELIKSQEGIEGIKKGVKGIVTTFLVLKSIISTVFNSIQIAVTSVKIAIASTSRAVAILKEKGIRGLGEAFKSLKGVSEENKKALERDSNDISESWKKDTDKIKQLWKDTNTELVTVSAESSNQLIENSAKTTAQILADQEKIRKKRLETFASETQKFSERFTKINEAGQKVAEVTDQFIQNDIEKRELAAQREIDILQGKLDKGLITQEEFDRKKEKIEKKAAIDTAKKQREAAIISRTASLFQIAASTAESVAKSVAASPLTGGLPWSAINTGIGVAQGAAVLGQPLPEIPKFATGGVIGGLSGGFGGEDGIIAAQNGESVLNKQATAVLGEDAINALNRGGNISPSNVTINVSDGRGAVEMLDEYFKTRGTSERGLAL